MHGITSRAISIREFCVELCAGHPQTRYSGYGQFRYSGYGIISSSVFQRLYCKSLFRVGYVYFVYGISACSPSCISISYKWNLLAIKTIWKISPEYYLVTKKIMIRFKDLIQVTTLVLQNVLHFDMTGESLNIFKITKYQIKCSCFQIHWKLSFPCQT